MFKTWDNWTIVTSTLSGSLFVKYMGNTSRVLSHLLGKRMYSFIFYAIYAVTKPHQLDMTPQLK